MTRFLARLRQEEKLSLIDPSENISNSYAEKSANCMKSARLLYENSLYENSVAMSYYTMYNILISLLYKVGIKSENHLGSILILRGLTRNWLAHW